MKRIMFAIVFFCALYACDYEALEYDDYGYSAECTDGEFKCDGDVLNYCNGAKFRVVYDCAERGQYCSLQDSGCMPIP